MDKDPNQNEKEATPQAKEVVLSSEENLKLYMGDPESDETKQIMEAKGIKFGDTVTVYVEGQAPMVVRTSKEDFWTRNRQASELLAPRSNEAVLAQAMMDMTAVEASPESVAEHQELVEEVAEPLGETGLGLTLEDAEEFAEVSEEAHEKNNGTPEAPIESVLSSIRSGYERDIEAVNEDTGQNVLKQIQQIEENALEVDRKLRAVGQLSVEAVEFKTLIGNIEHDYSTEAARTALKKAIGRLEPLKSDLRRLTQGGMIAEVMKPLTNVKDILGLVEGTIASRSNRYQAEVESAHRHYGEATVIDDLSKVGQYVQGEYGQVGQAVVELESVRSLDMTNETVQGKEKTLRDIINHLNQIVENSHRGASIDLGELSQIHAQLQGIESDPSELFIAPKLEDQLSAIRGKVRAISES